MRRVRAVDLPWMPRPARDAQVLRSLRCTTARAGLAVGLDEFLSPMPNIGVFVTPEKTGGYSYELVDESGGHRVTRHRLEPDAATGHRQALDRPPIGT